MPLSCCKFVDEDQYSETREALEQERKNTLVRVAGAKQTMNEVGNNVKACLNLEDLQQVHQDVSHNIFPLTLW